MLLPTGEGMSARPALQSFGNAAGSPHKYAQQVSHIEDTSMSVYFPFCPPLPAEFLAFMQHVQRAVCESFVVTDQAWTGDCDTDMSGETRSWVMQLI